ncbi:unnamed protein product [Caenorhabditis auriculariae]|uniref:VWFA domain-containing protein n=1 Tax=Caenorhabditis auriculariae TaxID=2777116 RepID=A0A8S1HAY9_9PELO|nr:unnamed protein product [Caenorhabditis auriculariae]
MLRTQGRRVFSRSLSSREPSSYLKIGSVRVPVGSPKRPEHVPRFYEGTKASREYLPHLKWLMQKDLLQQDVFLLGMPGRQRLELVLRYLEMSKREFEYLAITRDTTEADIKQRREIRSGTAFYTDLCAVRAALGGRILVIDGVERAERNVLPILNNLLENREMQLDDGRFLMKHDKYDNLCKKYDQRALTEMGMERVSEDFRVIALGLPVPRFSGHTLDPPFRSRFQCRHVDETSFKSCLENSLELAPNVKESEVTDLVSLVFAYNSETSLSRPRVPLTNLQNVLKIWNSNPTYSASEVLDMTYPETEMLVANDKNIMADYKKNFRLFSYEKTRSVSECRTSEKDPEVQEVEIKQPRGTMALTLPNFPFSPFADQLSKNFWIATSNQETLLADLAISISNGDFALIGPKGSGKSTVIQELSKRLRFDYETMVLHQDMNSRELIQRRSMKENGDTFWEDSQLVRAARGGLVCVLDGVEAVSSSVLQSLSQLVYHRRLDLPNGERLVGSGEFEKLQQKEEISAEILNSKGIYRIPETFRLLFVGESQSKEHRWINESVLALMPFHTTPSLTTEEQLQVITNCAKCPDTVSIAKVVELVRDLKESQDASLRSTATSLSLRRLIHIARRNALQPGSLRTLVENATLYRFLPIIAKKMFAQKLDEANIFDDKKKTSNDDKSFLDQLRKDRKESGEEALVPDVLFHENEQNLAILEDLARDMYLGSHLLLIGNQGVGKNKLTDRFLHLLNRPRQYMQLHRDTTVQTLTMQTVVENGVIRHEDSPLVTAARCGQVLVLDEADKAPLHVVAVLKNLLSTGTLVLGDGRCMKPAGFTSIDSEKVVPIHPNFRIIMLANRPGYPFLGNNLFAVLGDLFAIHTIDNPSRKSEIDMLKKYGPNVSESVLEKLMSSFNELRALSDEGVLHYPYSTRELVNIVRHCDKFPDDSLVEVVRNVFDFDVFNEDSSKTIEEIFQKHGIPLGVERETVMIAQRLPLPERRPLGHWSVSENSSVAASSRRLPFDLKPVSNKPLKMQKRNSRNEHFSEQVCHWRLPLSGESIVSGGVRLGDSLIVAVLNPARLLLVPNFLQNDTVEEWDLSSLIPRAPRTKYQPCFKMAKLNENLLVLHEEVANFFIVADPVSRSAATINESWGFANVFSKNSSWRMAPQLGEIAVIYERNGGEIKIITAADKELNVETLASSCNIDRVIPIDASHWLMVSKDGKNKILTRKKSGLEILEIRDSLNPCLRPIFARLNGENLLLASDEYFLVKGRNPMEQRATELTGVPRGPLGAVVDPKIPYYLSKRNTDPSKEAVLVGKNIVRVQPKWNVPESALAKNSPSSRISGLLEVVDVENNTLSYIPVPCSEVHNYHSEWIGAVSSTGLVPVEWNDQMLLTIDANGGVRSFEVTLASLKSSFQEWERMTSKEETNLRVEYERENDAFDPSKLDDPKIGKIDPNNAPHHGGNQWMGGTGGYSTAGLGGVGGPFRLDAGHDVHQMPESAKQQVPEHILQKAREISKEQYAKKLKEINMSAHDGAAYENIWRSIESYSRKLTSIIDQLEARRKEREWAKHQTSGDLDEGKLVESVTGEQNIFRRRVDNTPEPGSPQVQPKKLVMCFDVSGSMYRFNGYDKRLQKSLEAALMVMTALDGKDEKVLYEIIGHSGDAARVPFVLEKGSPKNDKQRLDVLRSMLAHTQYCMSGDNTLACLETVVKELSSKDDYDESVVVLISDANLDRYGIRPSDLHRQITSDPKVNCFVIFIGSLDQQADSLLKHLPAGKAFVLKDTVDLPKIMETIFASTIAQ